MVAGAVSLPSLRSDVERGIQLVAQALVVGPQRQRVSVLLGRAAIHQFERAVLLVVVELLQNPGLHLAAAVGEGDAVEIVLNDRFRFARGLLGRHRLAGALERWSRPRPLELRSGGCVWAGWVCWGGVAGCGKYFFSKRLKQNDDQEREREHQQQPALAAGFLLRILNSGKVC